MNMLATLEFRIQNAEFRMTECGMGEYRRFHDGLNRHAACPERGLLEGPAAVERHSSFGIRDSTSFDFDIPSFRHSEF
jgi:hypothetical protein